MAPWRASLHCSRQQLFLQFILFYLPVGLEWNRVHCYWGQLLAYDTSTGWQIMIIVEQSLEWMIGTERRSARREPAPVPQSPYSLTRARTRAAATGNLGLTTWATACPISAVVDLHFNWILLRFAFRNFDYSQSRYLHTIYSFITSPAV
jgi:hypothetical protein